MSGEGMYFFATRADMEVVLIEIEKTASLLYTTKGLFSKPQQEFDTALALPNLGTLQNGHHSLEPSYLVVPAEQPFEVRVVEQHDGSTKYAIDQLRNPHSIIFQPSGVYEARAIIMGAVTTISSDSKSLSLYKLFSKTLRSKFQKNNTMYIGLEAATLAKQGFRLTNDINRPVAYDLKI